MLHSSNTRLAARALLELKYKTGGDPALVLALLLFLLVVLAGAALLLSAELLLLPVTPLDVPSPLSASLLIAPPLLFVLLASLLFAMSVSRRRNRSLLWAVREGGSASRSRPSRGRRILQTKRKQHR
jgi:small-conductance mechanosensitive channel